MPLMGVTQPFLLEGAAYALEQAGILLRDAVILYDRQSLSSAIALALFGREELGKHILLKDAFLKVATGEAVELKAIERQCRSHEAKQARAVLSVTQRFRNEDRLAKLVQARIANKPGTPEFKTADDEIQSLTAQRMQVLPGERHRLRLSALYVGVTFDGTGWERPADFCAEDIRMAVWDAVNDYSPEYDRLVRGNDNPNPFLDAWNAWSDRPEIAKPVWPSRL